MQKKYFKQFLLVFILLFIFALIINLMGNIWLYNLKHHDNAQNLVKTIFSPLTFLLIFIFLLRDVLVSTLMISIVLKLITAKVPFIQLLVVTTVAEFVFIAQNIFDLAWTYTHKTKLSSVEIENFTSFSIYGYFKNVPNYLYYAAITSNLWELVYVFALALLLKNKLNNTYPKSLGLVFLSYGAPLVLWMIYVTFIQIAQA